MQTGNPMGVQPATPAANAHASGLSTMLREGTKSAHSLAESASFVKSFLKGVVDRDAYRRLVANLHAVYASMEAAHRRHQHHPVLGPLFFPELHRQASLEADLAFFYGPDWRSAVTVSPATRRYVERIATLDATTPDLLVAHLYTRYLGDLSGGQILAKIAHRALGLGDEGLAFYRFDAVPDGKAFKERYRRTLDALPLAEGRAEAVVAEAVDAFGLNKAVFDELDGSLGQSLGNLLTSDARRAPTRDN